MYHPDYAWMFFNWYYGRWWFDAHDSCSEDGEKLETVVQTSLVFDHYPRIEDERRNEPNTGKIVSSS